MLYIAHLVLGLIAVAALQEGPGPDLSKIEIINAGKYMPYETTNIDAGPVVGFMLNYHYFPAINFYNGGRYKEAEQQFSYVILRPQYLDGNPRKAVFMSTAYYLRGMIYFYHANGVGRHNQAKADFEAALKWNSLNHVVYLELSRLYSSLGFHEQAESIIRHLLELEPDQAVAEEAQKELHTHARTTQ
jgi:tetratricopeptide (TPR) repeat protein